MSTHTCMLTRLTVTFQLLNLFWYNKAQIDNSWAKGHYKMLGVSHKITWFTGLLRLFVFHLAGGCISAIDIWKASQDPGSPPKEVSLPQDRKPKIAEGSWLFAGTQHEQGLVYSKDMFFQTYWYRPVQNACRSLCMCMISRRGAVRSWSANQKATNSNPSLVESWTSGDLRSPHRPWTGVLSHWSSLSTFFRGT